MNYYAITKIRHGVHGIERVLLHPVEVLGLDEFLVHDGVDVPASKVAELINRGERVMAFVTRDDGTHVRADEVHADPVSGALSSVAIIGHDPTRLHDLPRF